MFNHKNGIKKIFILFGLSLCIGCSSSTGLPGHDLKVGEENDHELFNSQAAREAADDLGQVTEITSHDTFILDISLTGNGTGNSVPVSHNMSTTTVTTNPAQVGNQALELGSSSSSSKVDFVAINVGDIARVNQITNGERLNDVIRFVFNRSYYIDEYDPLSHIVIAAYSQPQGPCNERLLLGILRFHYSDHVFGPVINVVTLMKKTGKLNVSLIKTQVPKVPQQPAANEWFDFQSPKIMSGTINREAAAVLNHGRGRLAPARYISPMVTSRCFVNATSVSATMIVTDKLGRMVPKISKRVFTFEPDHSGITYTGISRATDGLYTALFDVDEEYLSQVGFFESNVNFFIDLPDMVARRFDDIPFRFYYDGN